MVNQIINPNALHENSIFGSLPPKYTYIMDGVNKINNVNIVRNIDCINQTIFLEIELIFFNITFTINIVNTII